MLRPPHRLLPALLAALLAACSGAGSAPEPLACAARSDCPADAFCRAGACVASAAPTAEIAARAAAVVVNRVVEFDGLASRDPDLEDGISGWSWSAAGAGAGCAPQEIDGSGPVYRVLFPCAGAFEVRLVVTDSTGVRSAAAGLAVNVEPEPLPAAPLPAAPSEPVPAPVPPPAIAVRADLELDHQCSGEPLTCTTEDDLGEAPIPLAAIVTAGAPVAWEWIPVAPEGLDAAATVAIADRAVPVTQATIRTPGAISGTWRFRVLAVDAAGRAAVAEQVVRVRNRPPVIDQAAHPIAVPHRFDAAAGLYRAEGQVPSVTFRDPDGDPLQVRHAAASAGDGGAGFTATADGAFAIAIPADAPAHLIGEAVSRTVTTVVQDPNGGTDEVQWPVQVTNRPPRPSTLRSAASVPHAYDAARRTYLASAGLSSYVDDDGDPIGVASVTETGRSGCADVAFSAGALAVRCEVPFTSVASLALLAGVHTLAIAVGDPWTAGAPVDHLVEVQNRPATVTASRLVVGGPAVVTDQCQDDGGFLDCSLFWPAAASDPFVPAADPDGDPIELSLTNDPALAIWSRPSAACLGDACAVVVTMYEHLTAPVFDPPIPSGLLHVRADDGTGAATGDVVVTRQ